MEGKEKTGANLTCRELSVLDSPLRPSGKEDPVKRRAIQVVLTAREGIRTLLLTTSVLSVCTTFVSLLSHRVREGRDTTTITTN